MFYNIHGLFSGLIKWTSNFAGNIAVNLYFNPSLAGAGNSFITDFNVELISAFKLFEFGTPDPKFIAFIITVLFFYFLTFIKKIFGSKRCVNFVTVPPSFFLLA